MSQINDLNEENVSDYIDSENTKYKLAIFVLPSYISSEDKEFLSNTLEERETPRNYQENIKECFEGSNWWYMLKVADNINNISLENSNTVFPFVTLLGKVIEL